MAGPKDPFKAPELREDALIAQIEAEPDPPGRGPSPPNAAPAPGVGRTTPVSTNTDETARTARTAREAAAAMAARMAARRSGMAMPPPAASAGARRPEPAAPPTPPVAHEVPARPAASVPPSPPAAPPPAVEEPARARASAVSRVPFSTMGPISVAERRGGVAATFVPAAGPIPFAHIGAFRWLMPIRAAAPIPEPIAAPAPEPVAAPEPEPVAAPEPEPEPAARAAPGGSGPSIELDTLEVDELDPPLVGPSASRRAPNSSLGSASVLDPDRGPGEKEVALDAGEGETFDLDEIEVVTPNGKPGVYEISDEDLADSDDADPGNPSSIFSDLTPTIEQAKRVADLDDPLEGAKDADGDGIVSLSDVLEPGKDRSPPPGTPPVEARRESPEPARVPEIEPKAPPEPAAPEPPPRKETAAADVSPELLRKTVAALGAQVRERDDIARIVLDYAIQQYRRAALFVIKKEMLVGWEGGGQAMNRATVRGIMVPLANPSIFKTVHETKVLYCGGVPRTTVNDIFFNALGDPRPERVIVVPFVLRDKVACVLYADGGDVEEENPSSIGELYQLGRAVSGAFENLILRTKRGS